MSTLDDQGGLIPFRVSELWKFKDATENWRRDVDEDRRDLQYLREDMTHVKNGLDSVRKVLIGFALSIAGSAIVFALTVLVATGKIGGK